MRIQARWHCFILLLLLFSTASFAQLLYSSSHKKLPKQYRDLTAIGHRSIGYQYKKNNWYSLDQEKALGAQRSADLESSMPLLQDAITQEYLDHLAKTIAMNSDAQFPITVRVIDSAEPYAMTLMAGHQYVTRGLLLSVSNEGELAAALARGIAHTALRSATGEQTRANLSKMMTIPLIYVGNGTPGSTSQSDFAVPLTLLKFDREDESLADYIGVQYLYKAGYEPECFISFLRKTWPTSGKPNSDAFSLFPPIEQRVKILDKEINEILPRRDAAITDSREFALFREHLARLVPPKKVIVPPTIIRSDPQPSPIDATPSPSPSPR